MKIAYIAAGAAGMYCGNCLHDHALALAMRGLGEDFTLVPTYTPLLTDFDQGDEVRKGGVFFNGASAFLQQHIRFLRKPRPVIDRVLNSRPVEGILSRLSPGTDAASLGPLTQSMLEGEDGNQAREIDGLVRWLKEEMKPDIVHLSNLLLVGMARRLREEVGVPVVCSMQSEAHFIDSLKEPYQSNCIREIQVRANELDGLVAVSAWYGSFACEKYNLNTDLVEVILPGVPIEGHSRHPLQDDSRDSLAIGYLARLAPEKGLDLLCDAFCRIVQNRKRDDLSLSAAGYFPRSSVPWLKGVFERTKKAVGKDRVEFMGTLDRVEKMEFLSRLDIFSVPARATEAKGLYVLEAMASGVPVVLPDQGVFSEYIARGGGGILYNPDEAGALGQALEKMIDDEGLRSSCGRLGKEAAASYFNSERMGRETRDFYHSLSGVGTPS